MLVPVLVQRAATYWSNRIAVFDGDVVLTYRELASRVARLANALRGLGLVDGDRVLDLQSNAHTYVETDLATGCTGLVRVALNSRLTVQEWAYIAEDCSARAFVYGPGYAGAAEELRQRCPSLEVFVGVGGNGPGHDYEGLLGRASDRLPVRRSRLDDPVSLNYSSGTTGRPKGCIRTARNRLASLHAMLEALFEGGLGVDDAFLHAGPMTHASGLFVLPHLAVGAAQVVLPRFDAEEVVHLLGARGVTGTVLVPTMLERVMAVLGEPDGRDRFPRLRRVAYAGAPMAAARIEAALERFAGRLVQFYGMVEAIPPLTVLTPRDHRDRSLLTSAGRPVLGAALEIVDDEGRAVATGEPGELLVGGDHVMVGYRGLDDATGKVLRDGWLATGDVAWADERGYVTLVDRKGDVIITGGYNVYPREVEELLATDSAVAEVAVVGAPDAEWGEAVTAFVVASGNCAVDVARLHALCTSKLSAFKKPKAINVVGELPKTATGKIARRLVRERLRAEMPVL